MPKSRIDSHMVFLFLVFMEPPYCSLGFPGDTSGNPPANAKT